MHTEVINKLLIIKLYLQKVELEIWMDIKQPVRKVVIWRNGGKHA